jgi:plastocyanin
MSRAIAVLAILATGLLVLAAAACGGSGPGDAGIDAPPSDRLEITSRSLRFDKGYLVALPNTTITVVHTNNDGRTPHNVAFYTDRSARDLIFRGELFTGNRTVEETFTSPGPGEYFFRCDAHPDTMTGTFVVKEAGQ